MPCTTSVHGLRWSIDRYGYQRITNSCSADDSVHPEIDTVARDIADPRVAERVAPETGRNRHKSARQPHIRV